MNRVLLLARRVGDDHGRPASFGTIFFSHQFVCGLLMAGVDLYTDEMLSHVGCHLRIGISIGFQPSTPPSPIFSEVDEDVFVSLLGSLSRRVDVRVPLDGLGPWLFLSLLLCVALP